MPPPSQSPFDSANSLNIAKYTAPQLPPPTQFQITPSQPPSIAGNPFKRSGAATHKPLHFQTLTAPAASSAPHHQSQSAQDIPSSFFQPPPPLINDPEPIQPENSEVLPDAPHNDRNQYLQTGHLSEETSLSASEVAYRSQQASDSNDYLPPPGLSRLVLGQPESHSVTNQPEIPPGLDRMVPGTELANSTQLNLERQADGQDTITTSVPLRSSAGTFGAPPSNQAAQLPVLSQAEPLQHTDRNLYLVPGDESDSGQRVVTGRNTSDVVSAPVSSTVANQPPSISSSEQRELVMDGENLEDEPIRGRNEPLEGANLLDDPQPQAHMTDANLTQDATSTLTNKKFTDGSAAGSTGNDDSDRERNNFFNRPAPRRSDDQPRRREKQSDQRYETEDTDYYSDRDRDRKRFGREGSVRRSVDRDRGDRDRHLARNRDDGGLDPRSARSDKHRDDRGTDRGNVSRRDGERYDKDRYRYETDGSRYETEDSRYDRQPRRRGEEDVDRKYRRSDRGTDGRRRGKTTKNCYIVEYYQ